MKNKEIWKPIKGFEGRYEVSNLGRVKRLSRSIKKVNNITSTLKEKILTGTIKKNNTPKYYVCLLHSDSTSELLSIAKLVYSTFIKEKRNIKHKDGNTLNNNLTNLESDYNKKEWNASYYKDIRNSLGDSYIKLRLKQTDGVRKETITPELIEIKRQIFKIKRLCKQLKN